MGFRNSALRGDPGALSISARRTPTTTKGPVRVAPATPASTSQDLDVGATLHTSRAVDGSSRLRGQEGDPGAGRAFQAATPGEWDARAVYPDPLADVVAALRAHRTLAAISANLPDALEPPVRPGA